VVADRLLYVCRQLSNYEVFEIRETYDKYLHAYSLSLPIDLGEFENAFALVKNFP
jgi:hypothetical protein